MNSRPESNRLALAKRPFLDHSECDEIMRRVLNHQAVWVRRSDFGFHTLGSAAYLDSNVKGASYISLLKDTNRFLFDKFGDLLDSLPIFLQDALGSPVEYVEERALPGFHVFYFGGMDIATVDVGERAHFDLQFLNADLGYKGEDTLSFTLPIALPTGGACLAVWPLSYVDAVEQNINIRDWTKENDFVRENYTIGEMILHDGLSLHAIGPSAVPNPLGYRVTLQGHGIKRDNKWYIYW